MFFLFIYLFINLSSDIFIFFFFSHHYAYNSFCRFRNTSLKPSRSETIFIMKFWNINCDLPAIGRFRISYCSNGILFPGSHFGIFPAVKTVSRDSPFRIPSRGSTANDSYIDGMIDHELIEHNGVQRLLPKNYSQERKILASILISVDNNLTVELMYH